jgi:hypothetical protein
MNAATHIQEEEYNQAFVCPVDKPVVWQLVYREENNPE